MVKRVYKIIVLVFAFIGALFFFGSMMGSDRTSAEKEFVMGEESYPILTVTTGQNTINTLYGYRGSLDPAIVRQSITPIDKSKTITINIMDSPTVLQKLQYEIVDKESGEVYYTEEIPALSPKEKKISVALNYALETSREYILSITGTSEKGQQIHYYTRIKYYLDDTNLTEKLQFAMKFHRYTFDKEKAEDLAPNLETDPNKDNSTLANVNIKSDINLITWAKLEPEVTSDIIPIIKEYNTETACIQLNYFIESKVTSEKVTYHVKEFYRVRYTVSRLFLLAFERTMEAVYNPKSVSLNQSQLKVGITEQTDMEFVLSEDKMHLYFARNGVLYHYNMEKDKNEMKRVFSVFGSNAKKSYLLKDEQEIRINKLDTDGSLYFTVLGYIPRGEYEGKVAVALYKYDMKTSELEELVYLPMDTTYQQLKEDMEAYSYVNSKGIYYFTIAGVVYSYNILGKRLSIIAENISDEGFQVIENKSSYVWSSSYQQGYGESITIFNLETDERRVLKAPNNKTYLRLLGTIDANAVIGYVRKADITKTADGTEIVPCYAMRIIDTTGKSLKAYRRESFYIQDVLINGNVLSMERCKKTGKKSYKKASGDSILNQSSEKKEEVSLSWRLTDATLTEWYIRLPSSYILLAEPTVTERGNEIITSERVVQLEEKTVNKYYIYALGKITGAYEDPAEAIRLADEQMGVVISNTHQLVWERGGSYLMNSIAGMEKVKTRNNIGNLAACAYIVLKANHIDADPEVLTKEKKTIYDMLSEHMEHPINLTGITLEQAIYFVSSGKAVIGMTGNHTAVVISEYTQTSVTIINPESGKSEVISRTQADTMFENAGNIFISYMN
ncbi:MAG: hypothetical protein LBR68_07875 [Lachnoclostridium sp.]|jgi:hypothetical protein|nr:hypothetical protein [Lachnoclostridium sp.]